MLRRAVLVAYLNFFFFKLDLESFALECSVFFLVK